MVIVEGKKYRPLSRDCHAVSEVLGQILMLTIVVLAFSSIAVFVFSDEGAVKPLHTPKTDLQESIDTDADIVKIFHKGGEAIDLEDAKIMLNINGEQEEYDVSSDPGISYNATNNVMIVGDDIVINTSLSRGTDLKSTDTVDMYFVYTGSDQVIQRVTLQNGNEESGSSDDSGTRRYWITPHPYGTATDTSGGLISTEAVNETGDGIFTTYYTPDKKDGDPNSTAQKFDFCIDAEKEGITGAMVPFDNVTLRIVYSVHDKDYEDIALDISVENSEKWIRVAESMPKYNKDFGTYDINLNSYVTDITKLENFKVRVVAVSNADKNAGKILLIDFLGIHVV